MLDQCVNLKYAGVFSNVQHDTQSTLSAFYDAMRDLVVASINDLETAMGHANINVKAETNLAKPNPNPTEAFKQGLILSITNQTRNYITQYEIEPPEIAKAMHAAIALLNSFVSNLKLNPNIKLSDQIPKSDASAFIQTITNTDPDLIIKNIQNLEQLSQYNMQDPLVVVAKKNYADRKAEKDQAQQSQPTVTQNPSTLWVKPKKPTTAAQQEENLQEEIKTRPDKRKKK